MLEHLLFFSFYIKQPTYCVHKIKTVGYSGGHLVPIKI